MPSYSEHPLRAPLNDLVQCVWFLSQGRGHEATAEVQRIPPDGSVEVIFHLDEPFRQATERGLRRQPTAMVIGVWTHAIELEAPRQFDTVGVRIRPGCWPAFSPEPASLFTNTVEDARLIWGRAADELADRLAGTADPRARLALISDFLMRRMRARDAAIAVLPVARILAAHGRASINAVARDVGISPRQLERSFRRHVGVSPKMLSRIVRFQHVLRSQPKRRTAPAAGNGPPRPESWADVAAACGYTDQSHLIRDVVQFAGESPTALAASEHAVADYFRRR